MMKILILDDQVVRHEAFARIYQGHQVTSVTRYSDFIREIDQGPWDLIHLDHDLGDEGDPDTYVDGWGSVQQYTGQHAAMRVAEKEWVTKPLVTIHSINPIGAERMRDNLIRAGFEVRWEPFGDVELNAKNI